MQGSELTTSQLAVRLGVGHSTARLWCKMGLFPNARQLNTPRGIVWVIPEGDLEGFVQPKRGRKPLPKSEPTRAAA